MLRFGTGDAVVAGDGIAGASRAKCVVGILTPEQQCRGIGHDAILKLLFFYTD